MPNNSLGMNKDHVSGSFEWEVEPNCSCGMLANAVEDKMIFVSNFTDEKSNQFYFMPLDSDGELFRENGVSISNCPWCGDKIQGKKKYSKS